MSFSATPETPIPPSEAWPMERRRSDMKAVIAKAVKEGWAQFIKPKFLAATYGLLAAEAEAELMRHMTEGADK